MIQPSTIYLERSDPSRNMARFYALEIGTDLFGSVIAVRRWGRIGTKGQSLSMVCASTGEAQEMIEATARSKRRRGYVSRESS